MSNDTQIFLSANSDEILLPQSEDGKDRFLSIEKVSAETISPLIKRDLSVYGVIETIDRQFSYPLTAHVGLKFDSRTFSNVPKREFDVKMKLVKVPSNYFPIGGNGLDRRSVYANPNYEANANNIDVVFIVDQNLTVANRALIKRNLSEMLGKLVSGYTYIRASIWKTAADGTSTVINEQSGDTISNFTFHETKEFFEVETPNSAGANQTNLYEKLNGALNESQLSPSVNPSETIIANYFMRKSQFSLTDQSGSISESEVLKTIWHNTVRKVIYFSGSTPETMSDATYSALLNNANAAGIQFYYLNTDTDFSGTKTLRELAVDSGGAKFNLRHDSDIKLQRFFDANFADSDKIYYGDWDGTFKLAWTDNPAWVLYDVITDFNYGLGNHIDSTAIDKWSLYDIGRYCDAVDDDGRFRGVSDGKGGLEPRYTCNMMFSTKEEAYKVLKDVTAIFKGITYWNTEGFSFFADKPQKPVMFFGNSNVKNGDFVYTETAKNLRHTSVEIAYNDKFDFYKPKIEYIEDVDGIRKYGLNPFKILAAGCTSRSEARRIGRYVLFSSMFESDTVVFSAGLEGAYLQPGDVFGVSDEVRNVARTFGRVLEIDNNAKTIKIDNEFAVGLDSGIYIHVPSGGYSVSDLNTLTGSDGSFTGTLENIRSRRQNQVRKFNIASPTNDAYGATLGLTGDFLLQSVIYDTHAQEGRLFNNSLFTGVTTLTGIVYDFPTETTVAGNPQWDSITFSGVSGVLNGLGIDFDVSGTAGTGQLIGSETNWTAVINETNNGVVTVGGVARGTTVINNTLTVMALNAAGAFVSQTNSTDLDGVASFIAARTDGDVIVILGRGAAISKAATASPLNTFDTFGAKEIYKLGADGSSGSYCYVAALIKGGSRILERAGKVAGETGSLLFTYRDLLALSKLKPYYTFLQADVGNRFDTYYGTFALGKAYVIGNVINYNGNAYTCKADITESTKYPNEDASHWTLGSNIGFSTFGFPKDFYGTVKVPTTTTALTSAHVAAAFKSLGVEVYVGAGSLGQTDLTTLNPSNGVGYSGLVYGTGYEKGIYSLNVNTFPLNLDLINPGSLYVLSGSGVEPKLYKTIAVKEEEVNSYGIVGVEYLQDKENFIERDMMNTSPSTYVQSVFDVVLRPDAPTAISNTGVNGTVAINGVNQPTNLFFSWDAVVSSPITGYQVYVSRPDYSSNTNGAITEHHFVMSGTTTLTIPINQNWGQYDVSVYAKGTSPYKLLSADYVSKTIQVLPNPSINDGASHTLTCVLVSGVFVKTADTKSLQYSFGFNGAISGSGQGNFTSQDLILRWQYLDPTGGVINSVESMRANPFMKFTPDVKISVTDIAGNVLKEDKHYQAFTYKIASQDNAQLADTSTTNFENVRRSRNFGFKIEVTDINEKTSTGMYMANNVPPKFSDIKVVDGYQNSPYYILSGYYGNSTIGNNNIAVWNSGSDFVITGSGVRDVSENLIRSEEKELFYEDIVRAFVHATGIPSSGPKIQGVGINVQGDRGIDYEAYVNDHSDLFDAYTEESESTMQTKPDWGKVHYDTYGYTESHRIVKKIPDSLGISDLSSITIANKTGFSGLAFTVFTEQTIADAIKFDLYSSDSAKDLISVDIYTGNASDFVPDLEKGANLLKTQIITSTRSYVNSVIVTEIDGRLKKITPKEWYFFKLLGRDDFGTGVLSNVVSGYINPSPAPISTSATERYITDGAASITQEIAASAMKEGFKYKISNLGTSVNWLAMGASDSAGTPTVGVQFTRNATALEGSGGKVIQQSADLFLDETAQNKINIINPLSDSVVQLPDIQDDAAITIANRGEYNIFLKAGSENIATLRPGENIDIEKTEDGWRDPRGNNLSLD